MSKERRFTEEEISAIFEDATETHKKRQRTRLHTDGLTLEELQKIGQDLGLPADIIAKSATKISRPDSIILYDYQPDTILGIEISTGQVFDLPEPISDKNWEKLIVDLRHVFKSQGKINQSGSLKEWKSDVDNIEVLIEPTDSGQRLRINAINENVQVGLALGLAMAGVLALFIPLIILKGGDQSTALSVVSTLLFTSLMLAGITPRFMPKWKKKRDKQMQDIGARALELVASQTAGQQKSTTTNSATSPAELPAENSSQDSAVIVETSTQIKPQVEPKISLDDLPDSLADSSAENTGNSIKNRV